MCTGASARKSKPSGDPKGLEYLKQAYFAGPKAKTAPDVPADRIFMDPSLTPRFEQPDNKARLLGIETLSDYYAKLRRPGPRMDGDPASDLRATMLPLSELMQHDVLFQDYPELKDMPVMLLPTGKGENTSGVAAYRAQDPMIKDFTDKSYLGEFEGPFHFDPSLGKTQVFAPEVKDMVKKLITSDVGALQLTPDLDGQDQPYQDFGPMPNDRVNNFSDYLLGLLLHETQHAVNTLEETDKYGVAKRLPSSLQRYFGRPTEMESFLTQSRIKMPPEERYKDMPAMAKLFEDNAAWKDEDFARNYIDAILAFAPDDPNYKSEYAEVMKAFMNTAITP